MKRCARWGIKLSYIAQVTPWALAIILGMLPVDSVQFELVTLRAHQPAQAWVRADRPATIFLNVTSPIYRQAMQGKPEARKELAAQIAHERFHLQHGPDEGPAYQAQIDMLRRLGARRESIDKILHSAHLIAPEFLIH